MSAAAAVPAPARSAVQHELAALGALCAPYRGCVALLRGGVEGPGGDPAVRHLVLRDLTHGLARPAVADVKARKRREPLVAGNRTGLAPRRPLSPARTRRA